jgi:hypothetical protein
MTFTFEQFGFTKISKMEYFKTFKDFGPFFISGRWEKLIENPKQFKKFQYIFIRESKKGDKWIFHITKPSTKRKTCWRDSINISDVEWRIPIRKGEDLLNIKLLLSDIYKYGK